MRAHTRPTLVLVVCTVGHVHGNGVFNRGVRVRACWGRVREYVLFCRCMPVIHGT